MVSLTLLKVSDTVSFIGDNFSSIVDLILSTAFPTSLNTSLKVVPICSFIFSNPLAPESALSRKTFSVSFTTLSPSACKISKKPMIPFLAASPKLVFILSLKSVNLSNIFPIESLPFCIDSLRPSIAL